MKLLVTMSLFGLLWLRSHVHASYAIDGSCASEYTDLIEASADAAIDMANQALAALTADPRDPDVERLVSLLFGTSDQGPSDGTTSDDTGQSLTPLGKTYKGIAGIGRRVDSIPFSDLEGTKDDVVIFCGMDRVKKQKNGHYIEGSTGNIIETLNKHDLDGCNALSLDLACTWPTERRIWINSKGTLDSEFAPSQVTLCNWFVKWASNQKLKLWSSSNFKANAAKLAIPFTTKQWPYEEIDALNLLDKVLLHEFTHTIAGGKKADIRMKKTEGDPFGKGYGWNAALELAKQGEGTTAGGDLKSPTLNSDSIALFGSGVRLLNENPRKYINNDGSFGTSRPRSRKRNVPVELQHKVTPAAFEDFITMVREAKAAGTG